MNFFVNYSIIDAKLQKGVNLVYMVDQRNKFQVIFQLPCSIFVLIKKVKRFSKHSRKQNFLNFFVDWSITDGNLLFEAPIQPGMTIGNMVRLVYVHMLLLREILCNEFGQSLPNQSWYGQVISTKLD